MKWRGLFFGLNYNHYPQGKLKGAINDTHTMSTLLTSILPKEQGIVNIYTDSVDDDNRSCTTYKGILKAIYDLGDQAINENLDLVIIHYSGHGSYVEDTSRDEKDRLDEVICPSDYVTAGSITDDTLSNLLYRFPRSTKVITIFDACHSGTITDLRYRWFGELRETENVRSYNKSNIISISGCTDLQISLDVSCGTVLGGALTLCLVRVLEQNRNLCSDIFALMKALIAELSFHGYTQLPQLCSSYDLLADRTFLPLE